MNRLGLYIYTYKAKCVKAPPQQAKQSAPQTMPLAGTQFRRTPLVVVSRHDRRLPSHSQVCGGLLHWQYALQSCSTGVSNVTNSVISILNLDLQSSMLSCSLRTHPPNQPGHFSKGFVGTSPDIVYVIFLCQGHLGVSDYSDRGTTPFQYAQHQYLKHFMSMT